MEDISQRTETVQVFANPDGTWTSEGATEPERVQDAATGEWRDVSTELRRAGDRVQPVAVAADVTFSGGGDRTFAAMIDERGERIEWRWPATLPEPQIDGSTVTYPDALPGVGDLEVTATSTGFSHNIIIPEPPADGIEVEIPVATKGGLLVENPGGEIAIEGEDDTLVAAARPVMWDSSVNAGGDPEVAPVDASVDAVPTGLSTLTLAPSEQFLDDPETVYPVTVDPTFTITPSGDTWVQHPNYTSSQSGSAELKAGSYDAGSHRARSFVRFDNANTRWTGTRVLSAKLSLRNYYSSSCTGAAVRVSRIIDSWTVSGLTWGNQPRVGALSADYSPAQGYSGSCPGGDATWNVSEIVKAWSTGAANHGVRIAAVDEGNSRSWRRYRSANFETASVRPRLSVTYNSYPVTPGAAPTITPIISGVTNTLTPELSAPVSDPDNGTVRAHFDVLNASNVVVWSGVTSYMASGTRARLVVPTGKLADNATYTARVRTFDGTDYSRSYSPVATFRVDLPDTSQDPVITEILSLADPGLSEQDVRDIISRSRSDYAAENGTTPTFEATRDSLRDFLRAEKYAEATPADTGSGEVVTDCQWHVEAAEEAVFVSRGNATEPLTLTDQSEPTAAVYSGQVGGEAVQVTLMQGASEGNIASEIEQAEGEFDGLVEASRSGAVDGDQGDVEVEETIDNPAQPTVGALDTVAYRLEATDAVEHGVMTTSDGMAMSTATIESDTTDKCARNTSSEDNGAQLTTPQGPFFSQGTVESAAAATSRSAPVTAVRYRTFIPGATASTGPVCGTFSGDNRSFSSYYSVSNRTRASVGFNWLTRQVTTTKNIGATHRLRAWGWGAKTKTASSAGIRFIHPSAGSGYGQVTVVHAVGNPLCRAAGDIRYRVLIEAWKNGSARISGYRVPAPAHEAYSYPRSETYGNTLLKKKNHGFQCLNGVCRNDSLYGVARR